MRGALYIVEQSFFDHEATRFREAVSKAGLVDDSSRQEVGQPEDGKRRESGGRGGDEKEGNSDGGGGGRNVGIGDVELWGGLRRYGDRMEVILDIDPIRVTFDQDHPQDDVNPKKIAIDQNPPKKRLHQRRHETNNCDKFQELLLQTTLKYSRTIKTQLSSDWQHNVDLNNKSQSTGLLYHATTKSNISTLKFGGVEPRYLRNYLSTGRAFHAGNLLSECILNVLLKKPQIERIIPDPVAVLSFEIETGLLEHDADRKSWVVLDLTDHHLHELQDVSFSEILNCVNNISFWTLSPVDCDGSYDGGI